MSRWFRHVSACGLVALLLAAGRSAADFENSRFINLRVGDRAPAFRALDDQGKVWSSAAHVGRRIVVLSFLMGDFFPECTRQACGFRDALVALRAEGADVVLVSGDGVTTHQDFKRLYRLPFTLLSDHAGKVGLEFGVPMSGGGVRRIKGPDGVEREVQRGATAARWTFILGPRGVVLYRNTNVKPATHAREVLSFLRRYNERRRRGLPERQPSGFTFDRPGRR